MSRFVYHIFSAILLFLIIPVSSKSFHLYKSQALLDTAVTVIDKPVKINVYPAVNKKTGIGRVFIKTARIGNQLVVLPMIFDTGSAGVTINALRVFPGNIVDSAGFKFKDGKDTLQYAGIIITRLNVQKSYGAAGKSSSRMTGNIGFADLDIGDAEGIVKMKRVPILFFYKRWSASEKLAIGREPSIFGVDPAYESVLQTSNLSNKYPLISPLKYLTYSNGVIAGFELTKISLTGCNINTPNDCPAQKLIIGLTAQDEANYSLNNLDKQRPQLDVPPGSEDYPAYATFYSSVSDCIIKPGPENLRARVLFDSGNPGAVLSGLKDSLNNAPSKIIELTTPSQVTYSYDVNKAKFKTRWETSGKYSVFGVYFFTRFDFLEDYQNGKIGLK